MMNRKDIEAKVEAIYSIENRLAIAYEEREALLETLHSQQTLIEKLKTELQQIKQKR